MNTKQSPFQDLAAKHAERLRNAQNDGIEYMIECHLLTTGKKIEELELVQEQRGYDVAFYIRDRTAQDFNIKGENNMDEITRKRLEDKKRDEQYYFDNKRRAAGIPPLDVATPDPGSCEKRETLPHPGRLASAMTTAPVLSLIERLEQLEQRISCQHQEISNLDIRLEELEKQVRG